jgi:hypothetical protein
MMDATTMTAIVGLLVALSIASERLVEIIKGLVPVLQNEFPDPAKEGRRRAALQLLAVVAGIVTAFLASPTLGDLVPAETPHPGLQFLALGLLASGGSGFWNSVLTYVTTAKDIKGIEAQQKKEAPRGEASAAGVHRDLQLCEERVTSNECYDVEDE